MSCILIKHEIHHQLCYKFCVNMIFLMKVLLSMSLLYLRPRVRSACFTITVPRNDPHFRGRTCMNMVRHAATIDLRCTNGKLTRYYAFLTQGSWFKRSNSLLTIYHTKVMPLHFTMLNLLRVPSSLKLPFNRLAKCTVSINF